MTALARVEPARVGGDLVEWAEQMAAAGQIARALASTPFVPASLRVMNGAALDVQATTANVAAALLTGEEIGLQPAAALRSIVVIKGTPTITALTARALLIAAGHQIELVESTATRCLMRGRRRGAERWQDSPAWTIERAKLLGLTSKENWRTQPQSMLIARATGETVRLVAPEVLLGLPYLAEEIEDGAQTEVTVTEAAAPARKRTARRAIKSPRPEPETAPGDEARGEVTTHVEDDPPLDDEPPPRDPPPAPPRPISRAQQRMIMATCNELGITERAERLATIGGILERDVASSNDLTVEEATRVIGELARRDQAEHGEPD